MTVFAIITEDGLDQFVESKTEAEREKKWLQANGFTVRIREFPNWKEAEAFEDKLNAKKGIA